ARTKVAAGTSVIDDLTGNPNLLRETRVQVLELREDPARMARGEAAELHDRGIADDLGDRRGDAAHAVTFRRRSRQRSRQIPRNSETRRTLTARRPTVTLCGTME